MLRNRFNKDRYLDPAFHFALPAVDGSALALYVDTGGQALFDQLVRKRDRLRLARETGNDKYVSRFRIGVGLERLGHLFASIEKWTYFTCFTVYPAARRHSATVG